MPPLWLDFGEISTRASALFLHGKSTVEALIHRFPLTRGFLSIMSLAVFHPSALKRSHASQTIQRPVQSSAVTASWHNGARFSGARGAKETVAARETDGRTSRFRLGVTISLLCIFSTYILSLCVCAGGGSLDMACCPQMIWCFWTQQGGESIPTEEKPRQAFTAGERA